jgi:hypothetical protein
LAGVVTRVKTGDMTVSQLTREATEQHIGTCLDAEAEVRFIADLASDAFVVESAAAVDWLRMAELVRDLQGPASGHGRCLGDRAVGAAQTRHGRDLRPT